MSFGPSYIISTTGDLIALKHIESINLEKESDDQLIEVLAADTTIKIRTVSGQDHVISANQNHKRLSKVFPSVRDVTEHELITDIVNKWARIVGE